MKNFKIVTSFSVLLLALLIFSLMNCQDSGSTSVPELVTENIYSSSAIDGYIQCITSMFVSFNLNTTADNFKFGFLFQDLGGGNVYVEDQKVILHFDTSIIPENAEIIAARLTVTNILVEGNPWTDGEVSIEIDADYFGDLVTIESTPTEHDGTADAENIATFADFSGSDPDTQCVSSDFSTSSLSQISKGANATTQLRLHITDTNDDDFITIYSGDTTTTTYKPYLTIEYRIDNG